MWKLIFLVGMMVNAALVFWSDDKLEGLAGLITSGVFYLEEIIKERRK